jgi:hypothetical protein
MWFTFGFFSIPIALLILLRIFTGTAGRVKLNAFVAISLIVIPVILFFAEHSTLKRLENDLIGNFVFESDTVKLREDESCVFVSDEFEVNGNWEILNIDDFVVMMNLSNNNNHMFRVRYFNSIVHLEDEESGIVYRKEQ